MFFKKDGVRDALWTLDNLAQYADASDVVADGITGAEASLVRLLKGDETEAVAFLLCSTVTAERVDYM
eukprot:1031135-Prymnesium_polylepis.1